MQFFSEDYLMHYGVKGMKWRYHKRQPTRNGEFIPADEFYITPAEKEKPEQFTFSPHPTAYLDAANGIVNGYYLSDVDTPYLMANGNGSLGGQLENERANIRKFWTAYRRNQEKTPEGKRRVELIQKVADELRRQDTDSLREKREKSYHKHRKQVERQQKRAKVVNSVKRAKNKAANAVKDAKNKVKKALKKRKRK